AQAQAGGDEPAAEPKGAAPTEMPPPPPANPGEPQDSEAPAEQEAEPAPAQGAPTAAPPSGQWVYTAQYGWVWMPYAQSYTYITPDGSTPYEYVYWPGYGWRWALAPWVFGWGPRPHWGVYGITRFYWHAHPWFRPYAHRWYTYRVDHHYHGGW